MPMPPVATVAPQVVTTARGDVEYDLSPAGMGTDAGPVVVMFHAGLGGVDQGRLIGDWLVRSGCRLLSFSRPGYLGTPLSSGETFEQQADLAAALLDVLGLEHVAAMSLSAGGPAAYLFAARHPERMTALLAVSSVSGDYVMPETVGPVGEAIVMSAAGQRVMRGFMNRFPRAFLSASLAGIGYLPRDKKDRYVDHVLHEPEKVAFMRGIIETMHPYARRKLGNENDMRQLRAMDRLPFDKIGCPVLIVHGTLDADVKLYDGVRAAESIPSAEHCWIEDGDHLAFWLSPQADKVQARALEFLRGAEHAHSAR